jgi:hypothetical protein
MSSRSRRPLSVWASSGLSTARRTLLP